LNVPPATVKVAVPLALRWFTVTSGMLAVPPVMVNVPSPSVAMASPAVACVMFSAPPEKLYVLSSVGQWPRRMAAFSLWPLPATLSVPHQGSAQTGCATFLQQG
jgi:hypothetical protein